MNSKLKVSIIMPAYNSEDSIKASIESVINQSYFNWELIIVDDGSVDNTLNICKAFENKDSRIKVYHESNKGPSFARNVGLRVVDGDLLMFLDADDSLVLNSLEILTNYFNEDKDLDLCIFSWNTIYNNKKDVHKFSLKELHADKEKLFQNIVYSKDWNMYSGGYPWNKIWKVKSLIKREMIYFNENLYVLEDRLFVLNCIDKIKRMKILDIPLYNYVIRANSISHSSNEFSSLKGDLEGYKAIKMQYKYLVLHHKSAIKNGKKALFQQQIKCLYNYYQIANRNKCKESVLGIITDFENSKFYMLSLKDTLKFLWIKYNLRKS